MNMFSLCAVYSYIRMYTNNCVCVCVVCVPLRDRNIVARLMRSAAAAAASSRCSRDRHRRTFGRTSANLIILIRLWVVYHLKMFS